MDRSSDNDSDDDSNSNNTSSIVTNSKMRRKIGFKNEKSDDEQQSIDGSISNNDPFETYLVISFASDVNTKTLHWIVDKIRGKKSHGGAELLLRMEPDKV